MSRPHRDSCLDDDCPGCDLAQEMYDARRADDAARWKAREDREREAASEVAS